MITCRHGGKVASVPISREQFEDLTADLLQRTIDTAELVVAQAKLNMSDLHAIVLVGGSTLMPKVGKSLKQLTGIEPFRELSPHTAVAQGAAIHAAILEAKYRGESSDLTERIRKRLALVKQDNVNSHGLGVSARNPKTGKMMNHVMIARNTRLPVEAKQTFATIEPNQQRVSIKVLEGDAPDPAACSLVGMCRITNLPPNLPKGSPIEVKYSFDASGRIRVQARDKTGGNVATIEIERRGGLDDKQVDALSALASSYKVD
jgi:molecular chaperone DnaK